MTELNDFESDILRLLTIWLRLMTVYKEFPKLKEKGIHGGLVRSIFREYTVINLVSFIKARNDLLRHKEFKKLDSFIKPLIDPILQYEKAIYDLRNEYLAHVQEKNRKFKVMINDIILKYNFPTNFGFYRYLAGLVFFYSGMVERNFKSEWDNALRKHDAKLGVALSISSGFKMADADKKITEILKHVEINLFDNGFISTISKEQIEKIRKSI